MEKEKKEDLKTRIAKNGEPKEILKEEKKTIYEKLMYIQSELKAPKGQYNSFGKYSYRSCEDIIEALKPLCFKYETTLMLSDEIKEISGKIYVQATASLFDVETKEFIETEAYAREQDTKKGMDEMQITGSASSYARKYALNGLFAIDDNKDADFQDNRQEGNKEKKENKNIQNKEETLGNIRMNSLLNGKTAEEKKIIEEFLTQYDIDVKRLERVSEDNFQEVKAKANEYINEKKEVNNE